MNNFPLPLKIQLPNQSPFNPPSCKTMYGFSASRTYSGRQHKKVRTAVKRLKVIQLDKGNTTDQTEITPDIFSILVARKP